MRVKHSSRTVRLLGGVAISFGFVGLVGQGSSLLRAQESPSLPAPDVKSEEPISLADVISNDVPATFSQNAIEELLPESWTDWGFEVSNLFIELYEDEPGPEKVESILERLAVKRQTLDKAIGDSKYSMIRSRLMELRSQIDRNVALVEAVQKALAEGGMVDPADVANEAFAKLSQRVSNARGDLDRVSTGDQWKSYFQLDALAEIANAKAVTEDDKKLLAATAEHLNNLSLYSPKQADFVARPSLAMLGDAVASVADVTGSPNSARAATLERLRDIVSAVNEYESTASSDAAAELRKSLRGSTTNEIAQELASAVRQQFLSNNFRATVSESLIRRLLTDSRVEQGIVNDCVFGARVVGSQLTGTHLTVDLVQSISSAKFRLDLNGTVNTNTRGITPQATVFTKGNHTFTSSKWVTFDGDRFSSTAATVSANANNWTYNAAASTKIPIVKGIIRKIAISRARELKPRSDALAEQKISDRVKTDFDTEVLEMLGKAEDRLDNELNARLRSVGLYPERQTVSSTDTTLDLAARVMAGDEVAASPPPSIPYVSTGFAVQLHDSYMNNALNRMDFRGRTMTSEEMKAEFERFAEQALQRDISMGSRSEVIEQSDDDGEEDLSDAKFVFDEKDPIRVRIAADRLYLTIKAGLQTEKETIDPQIIEIPLDIVLEGSDVLINRGTISVRPVSAPRNRLRQIAQANVMRTKIRQTLPERRVNGSFDLSLEERTIPMVLQSLDLTDGWMTLRAN